jgi:hypothetical protein
MCYVNVTNPPFYKRECSDRPDTNYYRYSIAGYDPCYYFDFSKIHTLKFKLYCQVFDEKGFIEPNKENIGYKYRDVVDVSTFEEEAMHFKYAATNPETRFSFVKP